MRSQETLRRAQNVFCTDAEDGSPIPLDHPGLARFSKLAQLGLLSAHRGSLGGVGQPTTWLPASLQVIAPPELYLTPPTGAVRAFVPLDPQQARANLLPGRPVFLPMQQSATYSSKLAERIFKLQTLGPPLGSMRHSQYALPRQEHGLCSLLIML